MKILNDISNEQDRKTIIFVETKRRADEITRNVNRRGYKAVSIHGDKSQSDRDQTLNAFRSGRMNIQILVATDVASRGLGESSMFSLCSISRLLSVRYLNGRDLSLSVSPQKEEPKWNRKMLFLVPEIILLFCRIFSRLGDDFV